MWTITTVNRCDHPKEGGVQQRLSEFTQRPPQNYTCGGPRRSHPRDTPGWTAHHFGAGHKQAEARQWTLVPAPPPSGQHPPTWRPVFARRPGPRGASAAGPHIPMVGNHRAVFSPQAPLDLGYERAAARLYSWDAARTTRGNRHFF